MKKFNNLAQAQVLEAILVAGLLLTSLYFVRSLDITSSSVVESGNRLETQANGILESLEGEPDTDGDNSSLLAKLVKSYLDLGGLNRYNNEIIQRIDDGLPEGTLYKLILVNISKMFYNGSTLIQNCIETMFEHSVWINEGVRASRYVVVNGFVYEIIISMWVNLRR